MEKFTVVKGIAAPMPMANITTDSMSPSAAGRSASVDLGAMLFANLRYGANGEEVPDFVLNRPAFRRSVIIVAGPNFGCGSSRERAVWALMRFGIRCVIAPSFGDIFHDNALQNGLLPVKLAESECTALMEALNDAAAKGDDASLTVDLERSIVEGPDGRRLPFSVSAERRAALLEGLDEISVIVRMDADIDAFQQADAKRRPWVYLDR
jgi:3-isopropylmalate/(R)-2-methylmalate dehydratase small subunit